MEYGASAEDIARVCHTHPVSFMDLLTIIISTVCDDVGEGGDGCRHMMDQHRLGVREIMWGVKKRRGEERERERERVMVRLFLSFRRVQRL